MKLKLQMQKLLKKHGRMLVKEVLEEVAVEERIFHDVLGCGDCYIDPHSRHISLSRRLSTRSWSIPYLSLPIPPHCCYSL